MAELCTTCRLTSEWKHYSLAQRRIKQKQKQKNLLSTLDMDDSVHCSSMYFYDVAPELNVNCLLVTTRPGGCKLIYFVYTGGKRVFIDRLIPLICFYYIQLNLPTCVRSGRRLSLRAKEKDNPQAPRSHTDRSFRRLANVA